MGKSDKLLERMRRNPRDWRIEELEVIAQRYGMTVRRGGGSHAVFSHPTSTIVVTVPAHRPVKPVYVKQLVALIDDLGDER